MDGNVVQENSGSTGFIAPVLDPGFVASFGSTISARLANSGMDEQDLICKFWNVFCNASTQQFFKELLGHEPGADSELVAEDLLLWLSFGKTDAWPDRHETGMPAIQDINLDSLNWGQWIDYDTNPHNVVVVTSFQSENYGGKRLLDFHDDRSSFEYYGYHQDEYPDMKVTGEDCIQHITLHHTVSDLNGAMSILTDPNKKDSDGTRSRVSSHYVVSSSGIVYQLVDTQYAAWHAGHGKFYDYESIEISEDGAIKLGAQHTIPGNYNNYAIGIEIVDNPAYKEHYKEFTEPQEDAVAHLCNFLIDEKMFGGREHYEKIGKRHIVSHGEVDPMRKRDVNYLFDWEKVSEEVGNKVLDCELGDGHITGGVLLFEYLEENPVSAPLIANLRRGISAIGIPVTLHDDEAANSIYDLELARAGWQFKAKYLGRTHPELCSNDLESPEPYLEYDKDMNLDWQEGANIALIQVLSEMYNKAPSPEITDSSWECGPDISAASVMSI